MFDHDYFIWKQYEFTCLNIKKSEQVKENELLAQKN